MRVMLAGPESERMSVTSYSRDVQRVRTTDRPALLQIVLVNKSNNVSFFKRNRRSTVVSIIFRRFRDRQVER
jgi:hypothetical protein